MPPVRRAPKRIDVGLGVAVAGLSVVELWFSYAFERVPANGPSIWNVVIAALGGALVVWRRVAPLLIAPLVVALFTIQPVLTAEPNVYGEVLVVVIAVYSLAVYAPSWRTCSVALALVCALLYVHGLHDPDDPVGVAVTNVLLALLVVAAGTLVRRYRDRAVTAIRERDKADQRAREIAADERARIARELHDVVAHGMSIVVLQARGGRRMLDSDPQQARGALDDIERVASDCLDEMRRLLGILRATEPESAPLTPQPRLFELERLVEQARASGADLDLVVDGERRELAAALELSAYRIAQEALTNSLKHAPGSRARLRVQYDADALAIEVTDDGPGSVDSGHGHGLIGIRERVELFGGTFQAGVEPAGGFGVHARLPLPTVAP